MNEQANKILSDLLQKASNGIDAAVSFSQAQLPDVIHQLLVWNFTVSLIFSVLGIVIFSGAQYVSWRVVKHLRQEWAGDTFIEHPEVMFLLVGWVFTLVPLAWVDLAWLKIWLAPKLYLIEYASHLLK